MKVKHFLFAIAATLFAACTNEQEQITKSDNEYQIFGEVLIDGKPADLSRASGGEWSGLGKYKGDQTASVSYTAPDGYTVKKVSEEPTKNSSNSSSLSFSINYIDHTVSVELEETAQEYTNTVTADTGGSASGTHTGKTGETHEISATPSSGYEFSHWEFDGGASVTNPSSANTTAKIGTSDGTITAKFKVSEYYVDLSLNRSYNEEILEMVANNPLPIDITISGTINVTIRTSTGSLYSTDVSYSFKAAANRETNYVPSYSVRPSEGESFDTFEIVSASCSPSTYNGGKINVISVANP